MGNEALPQSVKGLLGDIRGLIESARRRVAQAANSGLVMLYWSIGRRIRRDILREKRADYGEQIVLTLSARLVKDYGSAFAPDLLFRMIKFAEVFPDQKIVVTLSPQLQHFK